MKKLFFFAAIMAATCLFSVKAQAQSCTLEVVYNSGLATDADFNSNSALLTGCLESYLLTQGVTTTATFVSAVGAIEPVVTIQYALASTADSAAIVTATTGGAVPFGFGTINCLAPNAIDGFGFTSIIASASVSCGPPAAVPTLSQWGIIVFTLLVLCVGGIALWRRENEKKLNAVTA